MSADKPIQDLISAPVVSSDASSLEAIMARDAKRLQVQANTDSTFDTVLERFCSGSNETITLSSLAVVLSLFVVAHVVRRR
jgi:hypothetical protein